ncbi:MAG TPA: TIGR02444 family protein [Alphaproteobacteria bacterium]|nr:TIGR02444 family protein [Alphaproteobacteria bacterium]
MNRQEAETASGDNPFWDYSVSLYGRDGIKDACLTLQDEAGADVNLLLFFCWSAQCGQGRLTRAQIQSAMAMVAVWRVQVLLPLRRVRRHLGRGGPPGAEHLRKDLLKLELDAERIEQNHLFSGLAQETATLKRTADMRRSDARYNCDIYFDELGMSLGAPLQEALDTLTIAATRD